MCAHLALTSHMPVAMGFEDAGTGRGQKAAVCHAEETLILVCLHPVQQFYHVGHDASAG